MGKAYEQMVLKRKKNIQISNKMKKLFLKKIKRGSTSLTIREMKTIIKHHTHYDDYNKKDKE